VEENVIEVLLMIFPPFSFVGMANISKVAFD
jgi:hypothetical protein